MGHHHHSEQFGKKVDQFYNPPLQPDHQAKFSHEMIGVPGVAASMAMHEYEKHQEANGRPPNHQLAKEILAGIVDAEVDKLFETKGLNYIDCEKAKHRARQQAEQMYDNIYGQQQY